MFYAQSTVKGHFIEKTNCIPTTSKIFDSLLNTHSTVEGLRNLGEMKLNETGIRVYGTLPNLRAR